MKASKAMQTLHDGKVMAMVKTTWSSSELIEWMQGPLASKDKIQKKIIK